MKSKVKFAFLWICRSFGLFQLAAWCNRKKLCILCYHGLAIGGESTFRPKLFMEPPTFTGRLNYIHASRRRVLPLKQALELLAAGTLPRKALVITIDDGFCSTYQTAAPLLKAHDFPATVYVTSYYAQKGTPIYRLFVQYAFWKTKHESFCESTVTGETLRNVNLSNLSEREQAVARLIAYGEVRADEQVEISKRLGHELAVPFSTIEASRVFTLMTTQQIGCLRAYGLDVQLHTHRHCLPLNRNGAFQEIEDNRKALAPWTKTNLEHLCYPSGEWSERHWPWLQEASIASAVTCDYGLNDAKTNRFALMRFLDGENVSLLEFEAAISGFMVWLQTLRKLGISLSRYFDLQVQRLTRRTFKLR
jgi:peptidoglycan/xylan/chitin deacetylase (PgdA/CDA1 family)